MSSKQRKRVNFENELSRDVESSKFVQSFEPERRQRVVDLIVRQVRSESPIVAFYFRTTYPWPLADALRKIKTEWAAKNLRKLRLLVDRTLNSIAQVRGSTTNVAAESDESLNALDSATAGRELDSWILENPDPGPDIEKGLSELRDLINAWRDPHAFFNDFDFSNDSNLRGAARELRFPFPMISGPFSWERESLSPEWKALLDWAASGDAANAEKARLAIRRWGPLAFMSKGVSDWFSRLSSDERRETLAAIAQPMATPYKGTGPTPSINRTRKSRAVVCRTCFHPRECHDAGECVDQLGDSKDRICREFKELKLLPLK